jgi:hypothetical protein
MSPVLNVKLYRLHYLPISIINLTKNPLISILRTTIIFNLLIDSTWILCKCTEVSYAVWCYLKKLVMISHEYHKNKSLSTIE